RGTPVAHDTTVDHPRTAGPPAAARESVLADQAGRWEAGDRTPVEGYLARFPHLAGDSSAVLDLIFQEVALRERGGEPADESGYLSGSPHLRNELEVHFAIHRLVGSSAVTGGVAPTTEDGTGTTPGGAAPAPHATPAVPGYEILGELGRGG